MLCQQTGFCTLPFLWCNRGKSDIKIKDHPPFIDVISGRSVTSNLSYRHSTRVVCRWTICVPFLLFSPSVKKYVGGMECGRVSKLSICNFCVNPIVHESSFVCGALSIFYSDLVSIIPSAITCLEPLTHTNYVRLKTRYRHIYFI